MGSPSGRREPADRGGRARRVRWALLLAMVLLYALSIPWYRDSAAPLRIVAGLPDWVAVAVGCYALIAVLNAVAWLITDFGDEPPGGGAR